MMIENVPAYDELHKQHRLLTILRALQRSPAYCANALLIRDWLDQLGLVATLDVILADLQHLAEEELCTLSKEDEVLRVVLTTKGLDVAEGRSQVEGILRPCPECPY